MKVSVIIAAYNIEDYIKRCLDSVIKQTLIDIEIIVVNDGSDDNTLNIINDFAGKDNRINVVNKKNQGLIEARKSGLEVANGEYILFVDGDDWIESDCLDKLYNISKKNDFDIVIYNAFYSYDDRKEKFDTFQINNKHKTDFLKKLFLGEISPNIYSKFIKRKFLILNNIQFPKYITYAEDLATVSSIFIKFPKIGICNERLYNYYQRANSITKLSNNKILEIDKAMKFIENNLKENNLYKKYEKEFEYLIYMHMFISKVVMISDLNKFNKIVYNQYKNKNIKSKNNKYIQSYICKQNKNGRIRINLYDKAFYLGKSFDFIRNLIKRWF